MNLWRGEAAGSDESEREAWLEKLQFLSDSLELTAQPFAASSPDGTLLIYNGAYCKLTGYNREELSGVNLIDTITAPDSRQHDREIRKLLKDTHQPQRYEKGYVRKDGAILTVEVLAHVAVDSRGNTLFYYSFVTDITEHTLIDEALRRNRDELEVRVRERTRALGRLRAILEKSQEIANLGSWELDLVTGRLAWSDQVYRIFGLKPQEFGATYEAFLDIVHPADRAAVDEAYSGSIRQGKNSYEIEHRIVRRSDGQVRKVLEKCEHYRDSSGNILRSVGMVQDITDLRRAEEELKAAKTQAELYLDLLGHDISNMHQIILMQLEMALHLLDEEGKLDIRNRDLLDIPFKTLERSVNLLHNIRILRGVRSGEYLAEPVDLGQVIGEIVSMYSDIPGRDVKIRYKPVSGYLVMASPLIKDVIGNLVDNAVKHSEDPVSIGISIDRVERKGIAYYRVSVEDNGSGIPDEQKELVFRRFKRGDTTAKGTGLGLYLVKTLVESFNGQVEVEDRIPGDRTGGARFNVYLPVAEQ